MITATQAKELTELSEKNFQATLKLIEEKIKNTANEGCTEMMFNVSDSLKLRVIATLKNHGFILKETGNEFFSGKIEIEINW